MLIPHRLMVAAVPRYLATPLMQEPLTQVVVAMVETESTPHRPLQMFQAQQAEVVS